MKATKGKVNIKRLILPTFITDYKALSIPSIEKLLQKMSQSTKWRMEDLNCLIEESVFLLSLGP